MELTFNNNDSVYVSEFKVDSDFNLHVERDELGKFIIWVKTTPVGNYAKVNHEENLDDLYVIDYNFTGTVYPKYIKIVSKVEPTYAAITTDGEVTEIKTQSKEIEITSNGTTNITPDSGFTYLDRVSVKTNVAVEGGGSGVEADDVLWMTSIYVGFPCMNVSKGTSANWETGESIPLSDDVVIGFASVFADYYTLCGLNQLVDISVSNKTEPKLTYYEDPSGNSGFNGGMFTGITIEGFAVTESDAKETFRGILVEGINGANYGWVLYLTDENRYFHQKYPYGSVVEVKITKFIASNGNEIIVPEY